MSDLTLLGKLSYRILQDKNQSFSLLEQEYRLIHFCSVEKVGELDEHTLTLQRLKASINAPGLTQTAPNPEMPDPLRIAQALLGRTIVFSMHLDIQGGTPAFCRIGTVTVVEVNPVDESLIITLNPPIHALSQRSDCRVFHNCTTSKIIESVLTEAGFTVGTDFRISSTAKTREWEQCVQYCETDLNFILRLAALEGLFLYHSYITNNINNTTSLHLNIAADCDTPRTPPITLTTPSKDVSEYPSWYRNLNATLKMRPEQFTGAAVHQCKVTSYTDTAPASSATTQNRIIFDPKCEFAEEAAGKRFTQTRLNQIRSTTHQVAFETHNTTLSTTSIASLCTHSNRTVDYRIFSITHEGKLHTTSVTDLDSAFGYTSEQVAYHNKALAIPTETPIATSHSYTRPTIDSLEMGVVVDENGDADPEKHTAPTDDASHPNTVRVRLLWKSFQGKAPGKDCMRAILGRPSAGAGYGVITTPRIGEVVLLGFLNGLPEQPYVVASVDSLKVHRFSKSITNSSWNLKTRPSPGGEFGDGHLVTLEDAKGNESITLSAKRLVEGTIRGQLTTLIEGEQHSTVTGDSVTQVQGNSHQSIKGHTTQHVSGNIDSSATGNITMSSSNSFTISSKEAITLIGPNNSFLTLDANGIRLSGAAIDLNCSHPSPHRIEPPPPKEPKRPSNPSA